uniref:Uncharacterized protein LOC114328088 n=1 Tax=Diabrotica virgifera virgifera TaxID=50390 RepID=A0A6P7FAQ5_DIAVI
MQCNIIFTWIKAHIGLENNEKVDQLAKDSIFSGEETLNDIGLQECKTTTETIAIIKACQYAENKNLKQINILSDSLSDLASFSSQLDENFVICNIIFTWIKAHIGLENNEKVDQLAKDSIFSGEETLNDIGLQECKTTTETIAIIKACQYAENKNLKQINILSDSLSDLASFSSQLDENFVICNIIFTWIKAHIGLENNEKVDQLAKDSIFSGEETLNDIGLQECKTTSKTRLHDNWKLQWNQYCINFPTRLAQSVQALISTGIFFTFMLQYYVPLDITWRRMQPYVPKEKENLVQVIWRTITVSFIVGIAAAAGDKLGPLIDVMGAIFFSTLGIFIPATLDIVLYWKTWGRFYWILLTDFLLMGVFVFGLTAGTYYAVLNFMV